MIFISPSPLDSEYFLQKYSERGLILGLLKRGFPAKSVFHDLYVRKNDGKFSQIDLIKIDAEGSEYEIIPYLIDQHLLENER